MSSIKSYKTSIAQSIKSLINIANKESIKSSDYHCD